MRNQLDSPFVAPNAFRLLFALCFQELSFFHDVEYFSNDDFRFDLWHCACRDTGSLEDDPLKQI